MILSVTRTFTGEASGPVLSIKDLSFRIDGKPLFTKASAIIGAGHKTGIVGRNGSGKTSLFKLIKGDWQPEEGSITVPGHYRIGSVEQEAPASALCLLETVMAADEERAALLSEAQTAQDADRIAFIHQRLADIQSHSAEARAATILHGLGFDADKQMRPCHEFSGGWRMRVALAAILFASPDLLLLDEPTNYLDLEGAVWLEQFLARYSHTALIISHDRELLNRSVDSILYVSDGRLSLHSGGYDQFDAERKARLANSLSAQRKQEAQRAHIQSFIDRFRAKATKARQAQSRLKMLERLQPVQAVIEQTVAPINFPQPDEISPPVLQVENGQLGYQGTAVLSGLHLRLDGEDRVALLGANGEGKSTLSKYIAGRLRLMAGQEQRARKLKIGYFAQHQMDELTAEESAFHHLRRLRPDQTDSQIRSKLGAAGFSADLADVPTGQLSGGQKARLLLFLASLDAPHVLILDEPTNHLDIESRDALVMALNSYEGAVILVSHDTHLVQNVADRLWLVKDGRVTDYDGDIALYTTSVLAARIHKKQSGKSPPKPQKQIVEKFNLVRSEKQLRKLEDKLQAKEQQKTELEAEMAAPSFYSQSSDEQITEKVSQLEQLSSELAVMEQEWLELSARIESETS